MIRLTKKDILATAVGTAQAGAAGTITLVATASAVNDFYNGMLVLILSGTGAGQARQVIDYVGATKVATIEPDWATNPDATSRYVVLPGSDLLSAIGANNANNDYDSTNVAANENGSVLERLEQLDVVVDGLALSNTITTGTAQAGAAGTITLAAGASATNDLYNGQLVVITGGTGVGQVRVITDYVGATKVATIDPDWATAPDNTSTYALVPGSEMIAAIGANNADNEFDSTAVVTNHDGSVLERLEGVHADIGTPVNAGGAATLGAILGDFANDSLVARLNDIGSNVDSAVTSDIQGKLGTDTELADRSLFDILCGDGPAAFPNAAVPANDVSLAEVLRSVWAGLMGTAAGENGLANFPAAAAPANDVSLAEVIRAIYDRQLGDGTNASTNTRLGKRVQRAAADIFDGTQKALFTVTGRVLVTHLSIVTSVAAMAAGASNTNIVTNPTVGTDANMCAVLDIASDENGTVYSITGNPADALAGGSGGGAMGMDRGFIVPAGTIDIVSAADSGSGGALGAVDLWYLPLTDGASVVTA